jgi:signal transduction histidine kinase
MAAMWAVAKPSSVRLRLTILYGGLFLVSGAALLTLTYLLVRHATAGGFVTTVTGTATTPTGAHALTATSHGIELHQLLVQSGIALAIMTVASAVLGWFLAGRALQRLEAAYESQRRFVANASHELRTPLAMMRTSLDVAVAKPEPIPPQLHALDAKLREGLDQADRLLESLLDLARVHDGNRDDHASVSLAAIVENALRECSDAIVEKDIDVRESLDPVTVAGSETLLSLMVANVIENAVRHNAPHGFIDVETEIDGRTARLIVENGGPRLDRESVEQLGRPFRRLGAERTSSADGVGLGLSIVAAVAAAHGGALELRARAEGGLRVEIELSGATVAPAIGIGS